MTRYDYDSMHKTISYTDEDGEDRILTYEDVEDIAESLYDGGWRAEDIHDIKRTYYGGDYGDVDILIAWIAAHLGGLEA